MLPLAQCARARDISHSTKKVACAQFYTIIIRVVLVFYMSTLLRCCSFVQIMSVFLCVHGSVAFYVVAISVV